mmetsp:Transcript_57/g.159  ORF Transcript_57/g.159 Transcript_57/m.159 type:complete len:234 (+) Transcript_57:427-1128(+)
MLYVTLVWSLSTQRRSVSLATTSKRFTTRRKMRPWAMVALGDWPLASWIPWRRRTCLLGATACGTPMACLSRRSTRASKLRCLTTGWPTATLGKSSALTSNIRLVSTGTPRCGRTIRALCGTRGTRRTRWWRLRTTLRFQATALATLSTFACGRLVLIRSSTWTLSTKATTLALWPSSKRARTSLACSTPTITPTLARSSVSSSSIFSCRRLCKTLSVASRGRIFRSPNSTRR